jgi:hypothetical protein
MADEKLYVHVILDRSGSMEQRRDATIAAFNGYVTELAGQSTAATRLSLTIFDSDGIDLVIDTARIGDVKPLTRDDFVPRALTPLYDAVGQTVLKVDKVTLLPAERVALAILTDGLENASREFTAQTIKAMLSQRQSQHNWLVQYLGANQDAWAAAADIGVDHLTAASYDVQAVHQALAMSAASVKRFRAAPAPAARMAASFTPAERASAQRDTRSS